MIKDKCKVLYKFRSQDKYLVIPADGYLVNGKTTDICDGSSINIEKADANPYHDPATGRFTSKGKGSGIGAGAGPKDKLVAMIKEKKVPLFGMPALAKELGMSDAEYQKLKKEHYPLSKQGAPKTKNSKKPSAELTEEGKAKIAQVKAEKSRQIGTIASECKCSKAEAEEYHKAVEGWIGNDYNGIRAAQSGRNRGVDDDREIDAKSMAVYKKQAETIERYIDKAPKYQGEVFRGISVDNMPFKKGMTMDMAGTSSWSSSERVARGFCNNGYGRKHSVVFKSKSVSKGTELDHVFNGGEKEVLVSRTVKFRVANIRTEESSLGINRKITYVELEEVV